MICVGFSLAGAGVLTVSSRILYSGWVFGGSTHNDVYPFGFWQVLVFCGSLTYLFLALRSIQLLLCGGHTRPWLTADVFPPKTFWLFFALLLVCWLPYLLSLYPGVITPDTITSVRQAKGHTSLSNDHPLAFTYLLIPFFKPDWADNYGAFGFSIFQTILSAVGLSYCLCWLRKWKAGDVPVVFALAYFCLMPVFPMYAITIQKDTLFAVSALLLSLLAMDIVDNPKTLTVWRQIALAGLTLVVIYFRHNGLLVVVILFAIMSWLSIGRGWFSRLGAVAVAVFLTILILGYPLFNIGKRDRADAYSVPLQQLSRKISKDNETRGGVTGLRISGDEAPVLSRPLSREDSSFMATIIPLDYYRRYYIPAAADTIKNNDNFNQQFFEENNKEFLSLWLRNLPDNLGVYTDAYLLHTFGYWTPLAKSHFGFMDAVCDPNYSRPGVKQTMGGSLYDFRRGDLIETVTGSDFMKQILFRRNFLGAGSLLWIVALCIFAVLSRGRTKMLLLFVPSLILFSTVMISTPNAVSLRYVLVFAYALPVFIMAAFLRGSERETRDADNPEPKGGVI
jgi:hypothetical protein